MFRCRACNSLLDFQSIAGKKPKAAVKPENSAKSELKASPESKVDAVAPKSIDLSVQSKIGSYSQDDPPDVEVLGRSSWTLLHSIAARYPETPSKKEQRDLSQFLKLFGNFYPCWYCGEDFGKYMTSNEPKVTTQEEFGKWLCDAHNEVNVKLGKPKFNCDLWKQRWKDGWE